MAADGSDRAEPEPEPGDDRSPWDGSWGPDGRIAVRPASRHAPADRCSRSPGEDLGVVAMLFSALLLGARRRPAGPDSSAVRWRGAWRSGSPALLAASQVDAWRFVPRRSSWPGSLIDVLLRLVPSCGVGSRPRPPAPPSALVVAVTATVAVTTGIGWTRTLRARRRDRGGRRRLGDRVADRAPRVRARAGGPGARRRRARRATPRRPARDMSGRIERAVLLAALGIGLAAIQQFGPLLWPYALGPSWSTAIAAVVLRRRPGLGGGDGRDVSARPGGADVEAVPRLPHRRRRPACCGSCRRRSPGR